MKNQMLDEYEKNYSDSIVGSDRATFIQQTMLITPSDLSDLKANLADQTKKFKELDLILSE